MTSDFKLKIFLEIEKINLFHLENSELNVAKELLSTIGIGYVLEVHSKSCKITLDVSMPNESRSSAA